MASRTMIRTILNYIMAIKNLLFPDENLADFDTNQVDSYYKIRLYVRVFLALLLVNTGFYFGLDNPTVFWVNILLLPILVFLTELKFKKRTFLFSDTLLQINYGTIETHQTFLPLYKIQHVSLKQTIFQERKNVADVVFQTASGKLKIPCLKVSEALKMVNFALYKIETSQQSWM